MQMCYAMGIMMKRVVVELLGNLTFCGIDKGCHVIDGVKGLFVETDSNNGLRVWCPEKMIIEKHEVNVEE